MSRAEERQPETLEALLERCVELLDLEGTAAVEDLIARHADHAADLRRHLARLRNFGLLARPDEIEPPPPARLGDFTLHERLGGGGMGVVYRATQESLGRAVAIKIIRPEFLYFPQMRARFRREVDAVARMSHPGIVPVHAVGAQDGTDFLVMELIEGCTLDEALTALRGRDPARLTGRDLQQAIADRTHGPADSVLVNDERSHARAFSGSWVESSCRLARQVAEALDHVHARGVVHRDVKPSNIALTPSGRAMILDFGLASIEGSGALTQTGHQPGSLAYMAPEQVRGAVDPTPAADVYALGATLYEMLTLERPFSASSVEALRGLILQGATPRPRARNPALSRDVETVCLQAMDRDPGRRYASAGDLASDLDRVLELRPIRGRRPGPWLAGRRWARRHPVARAFALVTAIACLVSGAALVIAKQRDRREAERLLVEARDVEARGSITDAIEKAGAALTLSPDLAPAADMVQRLRSRAQAARDELRRLGDIAALQSLRDRAPELWPARPERAAGFASWLDEERVVLPRVRDVMRALEDDPRGEETLIEGLRRDYHVVELWCGLVARGHAFALVVDEETRSGAAARARWEEAARDVARREIYAGLELTPQLGLVPLGRDAASGLWEFAVLESGALPRFEGGRCIPEGGGALVLVLVPGGRFTMGSRPPDRDHPLGSPHVDPDHRPGEWPPNAVALAPFFLSKYEMTQTQWTRLTGENPSVAQLDNVEIPALAQLLPVESVSWELCVRHLKRIGLEIPTEAQWEYACRAGSETVYATGNEPHTLLGVANVRDDSFAPLPDGRPADGYRTACPIDALRPNAWGFHHIHGNLWEWCREGGTVIRDYARPPRSGDGYRSCAETRLRVCRGGSFGDPARFARSAVRSSCPHDHGKFDVGVRPSRALERG